MKKEENKMGFLKRAAAIGTFVFGTALGVLGLDNDAAAQCTGTGCGTPTNSSASQSLANGGAGGNSKTSVFALPSGSVSAAGLPGSGDFYGALVNSCLRSFGIGALSIGYSNANVGRYDTSTDENGNQIPGEVQQCINNAIKQHNAGILMGSSDPTKAYLGIKAAASQDPVLADALTDAQQRSEACKGGTLNAVGVCNQTNPVTAEAAAPVAAAAPAPAVVTGSDASCDALKKAFANGVPKNQCTTGWRVAKNCNKDEKPTYYCEGKIIPGKWVNTTGLVIGK